MEEMIEVTWDDIASAQEAFSAERANVVAKNAVTSQGVRAVARVPEQAALSTGTFDIEVKQGSRTD